MKARSPLLGYNHNIRYNGRLYHVQTEDSGVAKGHIFTHLFYEGTILASKKATYDPGDEDAAVQRLMQQQHKAMLRELRDKAFDEKIARFFGDVRAPTPPAEQAAAEVSPADPAEVPPTGGRARQPQGEPTAPPIAARPANAASAPAATDPAPRAASPRMPAAEPTRVPKPPPPPPPRVAKPPAPSPRAPQVESAHVPAAMQVAANPPTASPELAAAGAGKAALMDLADPAGDQSTDVNLVDLMPTASPQVQALAAALSLPGDAERQFITPRAAGVAAAPVARPAARPAPAATQEPVELTRPARAPARGAPVPMQPPPPVPAQPHASHAASPTRAEPQRTVVAATEIRVAPQPMPRSVFDLPPPGAATPHPPEELTPARVPAMPSKTSNVIVTRQAVVVGGAPPSPATRRNPGEPSTPAASASQPSDTSTAARGSAMPPARGGESIFGDDPYSDKSLDDVILSYLSEDPPEES